MEKIELAPIVLFVYNRLWHTKNTIEALQQNELANESVLFIYADGAKGQDSKDISDVRNYIRTITGFKSISIIEREKNWGLAANIVDGVTSIVNKYGKIIVLEDDIVTSWGFLKYMNEALEIYNNEQKVMHVSGYMFPIKTKMPDTFFYNTASCWGWGTWARAWKYYNGDAKFLLKELYNRNLHNNFDLNGAYKFTNQLINNITQVQKTWAVKWYASFFLENGFALHPYPSLTNNIGHDGTGENCGTMSNNPFFWEKLAKTITVTKWEILDDSIARNKIIKFYKRLLPKKKNSYRQLIKYFIPEFVIDIKKLLIGNPSKTNEKNIEIERISKLPRFYENRTRLLGNEVIFPDAASFLFIYDEIFKKQIYKFVSTKEKPYIIDAGANIGLGIIFFKQLYAKSEIVAFEPDDEIFNYLEQNVKNFNLENVKLNKKGLWNEIKELSFVADGADGGRIELETNSSSKKIKTDLLSNYLHKEVDFLKIDIEGAELIVIEECKDYLFAVRNLFIEYHSFKSKDQELGRLFQILEQNNFRYIINSPGLASSHPFCNINSYMGMDLQLNIYAYKR